jgi:two-component system nitrate/nitrite response regulator NarL
MPHDEALGVLVADAHEIYRAGIARAITAHPRLMLIALADDGPSALASIVGALPDVALLDVRLPGLDGFAVVERLAAHQPRLPTRVLLLSAVLDGPIAARARAVGACGCLSKDLSREAICRALVEAGRGGGGPRGPRPIAA